MSFGLRSNASGTSAFIQANGVDVVEIASSGVLKSTAYAEKVYTITDGASVVIDPNNGSIQNWTLAASRTPTAANFAEGMSITLMITPGSYSITWTSVPVTWVGGRAPNLSATGKSIVILWNVGSVIYGMYAGNAA